MATRKNVKRSSSSREKEIVQQALFILRRRLKAKKIFLFGSRAKGTAGPGADFDFALDLARPVEDISRLIEREMEAAAGLYHIDIVYLKSADPDFRDLILRTGKPLA
ncbi:MAG: nucleotidyltransferase domain-containing protein [Elusimicrobiota bacterium]